VSKTTGIHYLTGGTLRVTGRDEHGQQVTVTAGNIELQYHGKTITEDPKVDGRRPLYVLGSEQVRGIELIIHGYATPDDDGAIMSWQVAE
jgi:hypothetical protein